MQKKVTSTNCRISIVKSLGESSIMLASASLRHLVCGNSSLQQSYKNGLDYEHDNNMEWGMYRASDWLLHGPLLESRQMRYNNSPPKLMHGIQKLVVVLIWRSDVMRWECTFIGVKVAEVWDCVKLLLATAWASSKASLDEV